MRLLDWLFVAAGIAGLIGVRIFEDRLFYDPFLRYFHETNPGAVFPEFSWARLVLGHLFRFLLNLFFSLVIVHFLFKNKKWTWQAAWLMLLAFAITFPLYLLCIGTKFSVGSLFSFYIRRFVIQPVAVLLIVPLYYYRAQVSQRAPRH